ncbi:unnamed protein product [Protopolystoma xenopodis]|uniref:PH domain-containing protein n=1 Tax=Protopolystoma xenopodis TaxID=117903 RepID=A0A3S5CU59_9PLAT|nr:unnamed protein product [Protopolystoma xenopodis]
MTSAATTGGTALEDFSSPCPPLPSALHSGQTQSGFPSSSNDAGISGCVQASAGSQTASTIATGTTMSGATTTTSATSGESSGYLSCPVDIIPSWPSDLLTEWWLAPQVYGAGCSDCIVEGDILRLGGPFNQTWQKKYMRLFPNRLELYNRTREGIPLKGVEVGSDLHLLSVHLSFRLIRENS